MNYYQSIAIAIILLSGSMAFQQPIKIQKVEKDLFKVSIEKKQAPILIAAVDILSSGVG